MFLVEIMFLLLANSLQRVGKTKPAVGLEMFESTPHYLESCFFFNPMCAFALCFYLREAHQAKKVEKCTICMKARK